MLTNVPIDLPTAPEFDLRRGDGSIADRVARLEAENDKLREEHYQLMRAVRGAFDTLNREGVLQIADATIDGTAIGQNSAAAGKFTTLVSTGNTTLGDASTDTLNVGNGDIVKDASGIVGLKVTPGAWETAAGAAAMQFGARGAIAALGVGTDTHLANNGRFDGTNWKYIDTAAAGNYFQSGNSHRFRIAASGTAGNTITWSDGFYIDANANASVGNVTLDAWLSTVGVLYVGRDATLAAERSGGTANTLHLTQNAYLDSGTTWKRIEAAQASNYFQNVGTHVWRVAASSTAGSTVVWIKALSIDAKANIVPGDTSGLTTTATDGFIYMQTCAGAPTGVPTAFTGRAAFVYDATNNKFYVYNGAWKAVTLA